MNRFVLVYYSCSFFTFARIAKENQSVPFEDGAALLLCFFFNCKHIFEVIVLVSNIGLTNYICDTVLKHRN